MMSERASTLNYGGLWSKGEKASGMFSPTGRDVDPEAGICLSCTLPESKCRGSEKCARYTEQRKIIKGETV